MKAKIDTKVARTRTAILAFVVVVAILIIGYGTLYSTGITEGQYVEGDHYRLVENRVKRSKSSSFSLTVAFTARILILYSKTGRKPCRKE